jgi:hypothetical protein
MLFLAILACCLVYLKMIEHRMGIYHKAALSALYLADAGLEDAKVKLNKNRSFPDFSDGQKSFVYLETVSWGAHEEGTFIVTITKPDDPASTYYDIMVNGVLGDVESPEASRQLQVKYNRNTARFENFIDWGSL